VADDPKVAALRQKIKAGIKETSEGLSKIVKDLDSQTSDQKKLDDALIKMANAKPKGKA